MRIGILMAGGYAIAPGSDGRKVQLQMQADALERVGHEVIRLNPWETYSLGELDALHVVEGGIGNYSGAFARQPDIKKMGMAPFIDTNSPMLLYRWLTRAGLIHPRFITQQGLFARQIRAMNLVVARSGDERRILINGIGADPRKVKIVLNGVNRPREVDVESVRKAFTIDGDFALHVSMFTQARKNVARLIAAAQALDIPLIIGGTPGREGDGIDVYEAAKRYKKVKFVGRLTALQRDSLYSACRVFCLPSIYEGTGLVALEAASYGANVIITERGGPPDYFQDLVDYVNPWKVESIQEALAKAWSRPKDGRLKAHVLNSLSWEQSAKSLVGAYESV